MPATLTNPFRTSVDSLGGVNIFSNLSQEDVVPTVSLSFLNNRTIK
jgi:hypothetical protein